MRINDEAVVPEQLHDRAADNWEPLCALSDAAEGDWAETARRAALALSGVVEVDEERPGIRLLSDIRAILLECGDERIATATLLDNLHGDSYAESGWQDWRGRGLKAEGMAYLLRPFKIRARLMRIGGIPARGFEAEQFADAFARYLPSPATPPRVRAL